METGLLIKILEVIIVGWFLLLEHRIKRMQQKIEDMYSKQEAEKIMDLKLEPVKEIQENIREDIRDLREDVKDSNKKLDKLIEMQIKN